MRLSKAVLLSLVFVTGARAQTVTHQNYYDATHQLIRVVDSTGVSIQYTYDINGNVTSVVKATLEGALTLFSFSPAQGGAGATLTLQGAGFSTTPASNAVTVNGIPAQVLQASASSITAVVPAGATTGLIAVKVAGTTVTSATAFTVTATPSISGITPRYVIPGVSSISVTGTNLAGASFAFPSAIGGAVTLSSPQINAQGTSATLSVNVAATVAFSSFVLQATGAGGASPSYGTSSNVLTALAPNLDLDSDGLTNAQELALGTDPANPDSDGDGMQDGWEVYYKLNPLDPSDANRPSAAGDGLTNLQAYKAGLDPSNADRIPPAVTSVMPASGFTNTGVNTSIVLTLSKTLLPPALQATLSGLNPNVTAGLIVLSAGGVPVPGITAGSPDGLHLTFTPYAYLAILTTYQVKVTGFRSLSGVPMSSPGFTSSFTTNNLADTTPPSVIRSSPSPDATGVPLNSNISLEFSKPIDPNTVSAGTFNVNGLPGKVVVDGTNRIITFIPAAVFTSGTNLLVSADGIKDINGIPLTANARSGYQFHVVTGFSSDTKAPIVSATNPRSGDTAIPATAIVTVDFSEPVNEIAAARAITLSIGGSPVDGSFSFANNDTRVIFKPANPLFTGVYTIGVTPGLVDTAGNSIAAAASFTFTVDETVSTDGVLVTQFSPPSGSTGIPLNTSFQVLFSNRVNALTINSSTFTLQDNNSKLNIAGTVKVASDNLSASFTPTALLAGNTTYCGSIKLGQDLSGVSFYAGPSCFTTGTASDSTPLLVTAVNPPNASNGIPLNSILVAQFNKPLNSISFAAQPGNGFFVKAGNLLIPGTAALSPDGLFISFSPTNALLPSTAYSVTISGLTDYSNNVVTPFVSSFNTGLTTDFTGPNVTAVSPADGATGVAANSVITITFDKPVNPTTINSTNIAVYHQTKGFTVGGTYVLTNSSSGAMVAFTPSIPLPAGSVMTIAVNNVTDFAGNLNNGASSSFTVAGAGDTTPPAVTSVTPVNGSQGMGLNSVVTITFSKPLDSSTVTNDNFGLFNGSTRLPLTIGYSLDLRSVTLAATLPNNATITAVATKGVTDHTGNPLADFKASFTTVPLADSSRPSIVGQRPGSGTSPIPANVKITLYSSKPLDSSTVTNAIHVTQNGVTVAGTVQLTTSGQIIQFSPTAPFTLGANVQVFVDATAADLLGNALNSYQGSFTVDQDPSTVSFYPYTASPSGTVTSTNPVIEILFSKPLDPSTVNSANVTLTKASGASVAATVTLIGSQLVRINPVAALSANTGYNFQASTKVLSATGEVQGYTTPFSFTTGAAPDLAQPRVSAVTPPDTSVDIGVNAPIELRFNKQLNPLSISSSSLIISANGNVIGPVSFTLKQNSTTGGIQDVVLTPVVPLPASSLVTVTVNGIEDLSGNKIIAFASSFTTLSSPDFVSPKLITTNPSDGQQNVPVNSIITLQFDKPIDLNTVQVTLTDALGATPPLNIALSANAQTLTVSPSANLAVARTFKVSYSGVQDLAGNVVPFNTFQFTTAFTASTAPPQITASSPENGQSAVPINALVQIQFNEPVSATSIKDVSLSAGGTVVTGVVRSLSNGNTLLNVTPPGLLNGSTAYTVSLPGVKDLAGNALASVARSFTTAAGADLTYPLVTGLNPPQGTRGVGTNVTPSVYFNKRVNPVSVNANTITFTDTNTNVSFPGTTSLSVDRKSITFLPARSLLTNTTYCLQILTVTDLSGNPVSVTNCFFTGAGPDTTPPVITSMNPPPGSVAAINVSISLSTSKPINPSSFSGATAVLLKAGGITLSGNAVLSSDSKTIRFTPTKTLLGNTAYTLTVSGFTDQQGNFVTPYTGAFQTDPSGVPDTTAPAVISTLPADQASGVSNGTSISVNFSKPVNPLSVTPATLNITLSPGGLSFAGTYSTSGSQVTFTPTSPLPAGALVQVSVSGIQDLNGNSNQLFQFSFTASSATDTVRPVVTSVTPTNNSANLGLQTQVSLTVSKSLDPNTITSSNFALFSGTTRLARVAIGYSADLRTVTLYPTDQYYGNPSPLPSGSIITVTATHGVLDLSGNPLVDFTSQFTTAQDSLSTYPAVNGTIPAIGATGVPLDSGITLIFRTPMDPASTVGALNVSQNGVLVKGSAVLSGTGQVLSFVPTTPFAPGSLVQFFLGSTALDTNGAPLSAFAASFTVTPDLSAVPPVPTGANPQSSSNGLSINTVFEIQYSKPLDPATVNGSTVVLRLSSSGATVAATVSLRGDRTIHLVPNSVLSANSYYYCAVLDGVKDTNGLSASPYSVTNVLTGSAADTTQPRVSGISPPDTSTGIAVNASISIHFSKPVSYLTVPSAVQLAAAGNNIPFSVQVKTVAGNATYQDYSITPLIALPDNSLVTISASAAITDLTGNALVPFTSTFNTSAGVNTSSVSVLTANPIAGATAVPRNAVISVQADSALDPLTVNTGSVQILEYNTSVAVGGTASLSKDGTIITFAPSGLFKSSTLYNVSVGAAIRAIDGRNFAGYTGTFSTSSAAVTTGPSITLVSPGNNRSGIPVNALLEVQFSSAVASTSLSGVTLSANGRILSTVRSLSNGNRTMTIIPPSFLQPLITYTLTVGGVTDVAGNVMTNPGLYLFTTGPGVSLGGPLVVSTNVADQDTGISPAATFSVTYNAPIDPFSLTSQYSLAVYQNGAPLAGTNTLSADGLTVTFTPSTALTPNTGYLLFGHYLTDLAGNTSQQVSVNFTTGN